MKESAIEPGRKTELEERFRPIIEVDKERQRGRKAIAQERQQASAEIENERRRPSSGRPMNWRIDEV